ncbi:DUF2169 domain-containing protein, partial [Janthinobacterium sp. PC23-8]|uniref:DUF2169 family type VI secretion system accessory protein n=1 Tax=Janthinobacterium sp. PC23-8 TaxID=2012679 RepID=UPI0020CE0A1A
MKIVKPLSLSVLHKPYLYQGSHHFAVTALGFFRLGAGNPRFLAENEQWPLVLKALPPGQPLDEAMPKQQAEALMLGNAHSPGGQPCSVLPVRLCVAGIDKTLRVTGERHWRYGLLPWHAVSRPTPFSVMPLTYQRAFGGAGHPGNPDGCGYTGSPLGALAGVNCGAMPNIEYPAAAAGHWRRAAPAGFGPLPTGWAPRKDKFGTYDRRWLEHDAPGFARDIDWSVFNQAPSDQWCKQFFRGGEAYCLHNVHPSKPLIEGCLPQLRARAFVQLAGAAAATEVALRMDTVWFLPEYELGVLVYHGQTPIGDSDALDVAALMLAYEDCGTPKSLPHYHEVMALRLAPATAALHVFDEDQLCPVRGAPEAALRAAAHRQAAAAELAQRQRRLDEMDADFWAAHGGPPPGHVPPRAAEAVPGLLTAALAAEGDFCLAATLQHARQSAAAAQARGDAAQAQLAQQQATLAPPLTAQEARRQQAQALAEALERAATPAYDLLPAGETGTDPGLAAALGALATARDGGSADRRRTRLNSRPVKSSCG